MTDWFDIAHSLAIKLYPCQRCLFVLARYGKLDPIFGMGQALLCQGCIAEYQDEEWHKSPFERYDRHTQKVIKELESR